MALGLVCLWADAALGRRTDSQQGRRLHRRLVPVAGGVGAALLAVGIAGLTAGAR